MHADGEGGIADGGFYQLRAGAEDKNLLMMITTSPFAEWRHWENTTTGRRGADYAAEKARRATLMFADAEAILGDLTGAQVLDSYTPLTLRDWTKLPWRIYAQDKNWIPHLKQDVEKVFDPQKNKLLKEALRPYVNELVCLRMPVPFMAVGYWYRDFRQVSDQEVVAILKRFPARRPASIA